MIKTPVHATSVSSLNVSYILAHENETANEKHILIIAFAGPYQHDADADYMYAMIQSGITLWHPDGVVIDLSQLKYTGGDRIEKALTAPAEMVEQVSSLIVIGPDCKPALASLSRYAGDDLVDNKYVFEDLEKATGYLIHPDQG